MLTGSLWHLALAIAVFLASHSLATLPALRRPAEAALGRVGFTVAYSLLSLALLTWVILAALAAPTVVLWTQEPWMRCVPVSVMPWVCLLAVAGLSTPNPFSIGPGGRGYDPARPGVLRLTRHPVVWALALWAAAHIVPNGTVAAVMLFAPLLTLALAGPALLDHKRRRSLGWEQWQKLLPPRHLDWGALLREVGWARLAGALALYGALIALHPWVIGRSPLP